MKKTTILAFVALATLGGGFSACKDSAPKSTESQQTTTTPEADEAMNRALRFYAGISREGISIADKDATAWDAYSSTVKNFIDLGKPSLKMVDDIAAGDFADFRDSIDYVFYPFSGADFVYPFTLFPNASTYFLCGMEKTGMAIDRDVVSDFAQYETYRQQLAGYFRTSYFASKEMAADFDTMDIDGVCPLITMLMAISGCQVTTIKYKDIDAEGNIVSTADKRQLLEIKFIRNANSASTTPQEQTLYYFASNVSDASFAPNLQRYIDTSLPQHCVGTYMKAASFLLHDDHFATMRRNILRHSHAIVQDDSGIPYRFLTPDYAVTLYGEYRNPAAEFGEESYQPDLEQQYVADAANIKKLPARIGYNSPSNWIVARRK